MEALPKDLLQQFALNLNLEEIMRLCQTSKRINHLICNSTNFWSNKLFKDFGIRSNLRAPKEVYRTIVSNKAFCIQLSKVFTDYGDSFLENIPNVLKSKTNAKISDILVFNYLIMKYLKQDMGQPTLFHVTYDRYINQYNSEYNNRITRGEIFTSGEEEVLREIIGRFRNLYYTIRENDSQNLFIYSYLNSILNNRIPWGTSLQDLCLFNIY